MKHIPAADLALYAGGDLPLGARLWVGAHLRLCRHCAARAGEFEATRRRLAEAREELPDGLEWDRVAAEMQANIRLGLTVGALVGGIGQPEKPAAPAEALGWRLAVVSASLVFVLAAGWWLGTPRPGLEPDPAAAIVLNARHDGLQMQQSGGALTLLTPAGQPATTSVSWDGAARARYIDSETGQVTIHHVTTE